MKKNKQLIEQYIRLILEKSEDLNLEPSDSLDDAIDKFLINAEKRKLVSPQDDNEDTKSSKELKKELDVEHFAKAVARLMQHYDDLLDIPNTIFRRAVNFITVNYDYDSSMKAKEIITTDYDVGPNVKNLDFDVQAPGADRTGPPFGGSEG